MDIIDERILKNLPYQQTNIVILEIALTNTLSIPLSWPHRQDLSADQLLSEPL